VTYKGMSVTQDDEVVIYRRDMAVVYRGVTVT
jgi:hypothetical protein